MHASVDVALRSADHWSLQTSQQFCHPYARVRARHGVLPEWLQWRLCLRRHWPRPLNARGVRTGRDAARRPGSAVPAWSELSLAWSAAASTVGCRRARRRRRGVLE